MIIAHVEQYFMQLDTQLEAAFIIGEKVSVPSGREVGIVQDYMSSTGLARIKLYNKVSYNELLQQGIPLEYMVFGNELSYKKWKN